MSGADDLKTLCRTAAEKWAGRRALHFDQTSQSFTFEDIDRRSNQAAHALTGLGIAPGDRVAIMLANVPTWPFTWLGIVKAGAVMVPVNRFYKPVDAGYLFGHAGVKAIVTSDDLVPVVLEAIEASGLMPLPTILSINGGTAAVDFQAAVAAAPDSPTDAAVTPETLANIQYTSGTTGHPKGCMLPNAWFTGFARRIQGTDLALGEDDIVLTAQPFYYVDPQWILTATLYSGAELVVLDRFHPSSFWEKLREYRVTWFYCLGVMPKMLLNQPASPDDTNHKVRLVVCSAIPPFDHAEIEARWGAPWFDAFGLTETGLDISVPAAEREVLVGTGCIGRPMPEREVRIVDDAGNDVPPGEAGELIERGPGMMDGYYRDEAATAAAMKDGWFHTGDLARMDPEGRIFFQGRKKDMIRRAGENISAVEVEDVIMQHPDVALAACVPVPDDLRGEEVKAYVVLKMGKSLDPAVLAAWTAERIAYFKVPRYWEFRDGLPRTPSERVIKSELAPAGSDLTAGAWDCSEDG